jgi:hypothetical protein
MRNQPKIRRPDWLKEADPASGFRAWQKGICPKSIAGWMIVVPIRHTLRCIYGNDLLAALALLWWAVSDICANMWWDLRMKYFPPKRDLLSEYGEYDDPASITKT